MKHDKMMEIVRRIGMDEKDKRIMENSHGELREAVKILRGVRPGMHFSPNLI